MKSITIALAALAIGAGSLLAGDYDENQEEIIAAIERQTEAIQGAIEDQTFQQQLDAVLIEDAIENSQRRDRWYFWNNCIE